MKKYVLMIAVVFLVFGFAVGCKKKTTVKPNKPSREVPVGVQTIEPNSVAETNNPKLNRAIERTTTSGTERRPRDINNR